MNVLSTDGKYQPSDEDFEALQSLQSDFQKCVVRFLFFGNKYWWIYGIALGVNWFNLYYYSAGKWNDFTNSFSFLLKSSLD
jgi:hypothetical protein